jgi:LPS O-antigen subunit length determinant protein (WzzB/FepE family)
MASWLDAYRDDFQTMKGQGLKQADMIRLLKERYGVEVKAQTLSDYLKKLPEGDTPIISNGFSYEAAGASAVQAMPQGVLAQAVMQGAWEEMLDRLAQLIEGVQQVKREGDERHEAVMGAVKALRVQEVQEALERHTLTFETLYKTLRSAMLLKIWCRAALITGAAWGVGIGIAYLL